ncbi:MAG: Hpt domain-containing protein, partial [Betaproteobacteria bacterium]|nr:Hpt domain-containing protein [Betaproteobacteria bacterium]
AYTDELERQLVRLQELAPRETEALGAILDRACRKLKIFLNELVSGTLPVPLTLFPEYEAMQNARGVKAAAPTDLFYPDLAPRAPKIASRENVPAAQLSSYLVKQRRLYQLGLLAWLRDDEAGVTAMRKAIAAIEGVSTQPSLRTFWWTVGALLEGLVEKGIDRGFGVKQLAARVDLQIRRVAEGSAKVADRLRREVLYFVALAAPVSSQIQAVQHAFKLAGLIPSSEIINADVVKLEPLLRESREQLASAKDAWLKAASGRAENLPKLKSTLTSVHAKAAEIKNGALLKLTAALVERLDKVPSSGVSEQLAMEYATALLLAESAFENYSSLSPDFPKHVDAMLARLDAARAGRRAAALPVLDEMSKRAQERVLLAQVVREIQNNLRHMEQVLDSFFRDHSKRADLTALAKDSRQIRGALQMLNLDDADRLLALCQQQIERYASPDSPVSNEDLELLAEALSGLGFYIEAVEQQRPNRERLIAPLLAKRLGEPAAPAIASTDSVEHAVAEFRAELPHLVEDLQREPPDDAARESLKTRLLGLRDDAELIGDKELVGQAQAIVEELAAGVTTNLIKAAEAISDTTAPAPEVSEETQRLLATDAGELDRELVDIFLLEAAEVLDSVAAQRERLQTNPGDHAALSTLRRGFHTLKGSGRMVGLTQLGDYAHDVEKVSNRLLEEERSVTPAAIAMFGVATKSFRGWIDGLSQTGRVVLDPRDLRVALDAVEREFDARTASPAQPVKPPTPVSNVIDLSSVFAASLPRPSAPSENVVADTIELPELGAPVVDVVSLLTEAPELEPVEVVELASIPAWPPVLTLVEPAPLIPASGTPVADLAHEEPLPETVTATSAEEPEEIAIGDVTLSASLWKILCDEADQHVATLEHELSFLQADARAAPSAAMIRASHTMCGIHRTGGFPVVAVTAKSLEQTLLALEQRGAPLPGNAQPVLARAVAGLTEFVSRVKARQGFSSQDADEARFIQTELEELRQDLASEVLDAEGTAAAIAKQEDDLAATLPFLPPAEAIEPQHSARFAADVVANAEIRLPERRRDPLGGIRDDVDATVLPIFLDEAAELFPQAGEELRAWRRKPGEAHVAGQLRRTLHTFKGSARMAGAMRLGELTHLMESRLSDGDTPVAPTPELFEALEADLDHVAFVLDRLRNGEMDTPLPWVSAIMAEAPATAPAATSKNEAAAAPAPVVRLPERPVVVPLSQPAPEPAARVEAVAELETGTRAQLRVRADVIDRLVNEAGEVAITRARVEGELRSLKSNLLELTSSVIRLRAQMREIEIQGESQIQSRMSIMQGQEGDFDPLEFDRYTRFQELTRSLAEGINDVSTVQQALLKNLDDADAALLAQARLSRDVQQRLFAIRTVPFGSLSERLYRVLRATAKELGKRANLEIHGAQVELDRSVLEKLAGPLEHLLRNALDHGIEARPARLASGKAATGEIALTVRQVGNEVVIDLADDGAGVDLHRVRERAQALGLVAADAKPTEGQLIDCLFQPGFSTASKVTAISGRGIGMDVVKSEIAALGGRVEVVTTPGMGTRFTLTMPLTLAVAQAVLVRAGGRLWALPAAMVEQVQQVKAKALLDLYVVRKVDWQGRAYPFHYLPRLLGDETHNPE